MHSRQRLSQLLFCLALLLTPCLASTPAAAEAALRSTPTVSASFKSSVNAAVRKAREIAPELGVHIVDARSGVDAYSYNADQQRIVASNTKLVTTAAALDRLGPGAYFETSLIVNGDIDGGILRGDLGIVGGGDPTISGRFYQDDPFGAFREWAAILESHGITRVDGDLVLITGFFDDQWVHPDWPKDQLDKWYEAPVSALSFNDNCVLATAQPQGGPDAIVALDPDLPVLQLAGEVAVTSKANQQWLRFSRNANAATAEQRSTIHASGRVYRHGDRAAAAVTVPDPVAFFGAAVRQALAGEGIAISGGTLRSIDLPAGSWRLAHVHRTGLLDVIEVTNKRSQNFFAESLLKLLGARQCDDGSWHGGLRVVRDFLEQTVGWSAGSYRLADGSGMSRNNRLTPRHLTHLLRYMTDHPLGTELMRSLPYSGERDLRWRSRLADPPYAGNVFAKTGTLSGVSTLSGYAKARSGKLYAFSILLNRTRGAWHGKKAQDRILRAVIDHG